MQTEPALAPSVRDYLAKRLHFLNLEHNFRDIFTLISAYLREVSLRRQTGSRDLVPIDVIADLCSRFVAANASQGQAIIAKRIVAAYSSGLPLNDVLGPHAKVSWRSMQEELQVWLGEQVQLTARARSCAEVDLIDISQRQLQNWRRRTPNS